MNWDDVKIFLSVARRKKLAAAAADIKQDTTTISRRIKRLEEDLGQTLFERLRSGHILTVHGEQLLVQAEQIEAKIENIHRSESAATHMPSGTIRISVAEGFGVEILAPILGSFTSSYPAIEIDLVSGSGFLSLSKREADVAIGLTRSKSRHIISELLSSYELHLYAHPNYLNKSSPISSLTDLNDHTLIDYVDDLLYSEELKYFERYLPTHRPDIRCTSIMAQKKLVENSTGIAILPDFLANSDLVQVFPNQIHLERKFWYSCHHSVAPLTKMKKFREFIFSQLGGKIKSTRAI